MRQGAITGCSFVYGRFRTTPDDAGFPAWWTGLPQRAVAVAVVAGLAAACRPAGPEGPGTAGAPAEPEDPRSRFVGTWKLAEVERYDQRGVPLSDLVHSTIGVPGALGLLMYDGERVAVSVQQAGRAASGRDGRTPDEALAAVESYTAHFGPYAVDEAAGYVAHRMVGSLNPRLAGGETQPFYEFSADRLVLVPALQCPDSYVAGRGCAYGTTGIQLRNVWEKLEPAPDSGEDARPFLGFWEIDRIERRALDGGESIPMAQYAEGYLAYMPSGYMAVHLMRPDRPRYEGPRPTPAEADAAMRGYVSYFGPFSVQAGEGVVVHHRAGHLDPDRTGSAARRAFTFRDGQLILEPPASTIDGRRVQTTVFWNRLSALGPDAVD